MTNTHQIQPTFHPPLHTQSLCAGKEGTQYHRISPVSVGVPIASRDALRYGGRGRDVHGGIPSQEVRDGRLEDGFDHLEFAGLDRDFQRRRLRREGGGRRQDRSLYIFELAKRVATKTRVEKRRENK